MFITENKRGQIFYEKEKKVNPFDDDNQVLGVLVKESWRFFITRGLQEIIWIKFDRIFLRKHTCIFNNGLLSFST